MDRQKAQKLLDLFNEGSYIGHTGKTHLYFARQSMQDVEDIEAMSDDELIQQWKGLVQINCIIGQVSLNEMEKINLIEMEMDERENISADELRQWFNEAKESYEKQESGEVE